MALSDIEKLKQEIIQNCTVITTKESHVGRGEKIPVVDLYLHRGMKNIRKHVGNYKIIFSYFLIT